MERITDNKMLKQGGWEALVYDFGCGLIHLSNKHLYQDVDPVIKMAKEKQDNIVKYLNFHHGFEKKEINMNDLIKYLPVIYKKIYENIESHIETISLINNETKVFKD